MTSGHALKSPLQREVMQSDAFRKRVEYHIDIRVDILDIEHYFALLHSDITSFYLTVIRIFTHPMKTAIDQPEVFGSLHME